MNEYIIILEEINYKKKKEKEKEKVKEINHQKAETGDSRLD